MKIQKILIFSSLLFAPAIIISSAAALVPPTDAQLRTIIENDDVQAMARYIHAFPGDMDTRNAFGNPLILEAVEYGAIGIVELLIMENVNTQVKSPDDDGIWWFIGSVAMNNPDRALEIARLLHTNQIGGINHRGIMSGMTPLMSIAMEGTPELFRLFLEAGADINALDDSDFPVLWYIQNNPDDNNRKEILAIYHEFVDRQKKGM